jgi:hypothetical protein
MAAFVVYGSTFDFRGENPWQLSARLSKVTLVCFIYKWSLKSHYNIKLRCTDLETFRMLSHRQDRWSCLGKASFPSEWCSLIIRRLWLNFWQKPSTTLILSSWHTNASSPITTKSSTSISTGLKPLVRPVRTDSARSVVIPETTTKSWVVDAVRTIPQQFTTSSRITITLRHKMLYISAPFKDFLLRSRSSFRKKVRFCIWTEVGSSQSLGISKCWMC